MTRTFFLLITAVLATSCASGPAPLSRGHEFQEVGSLSALPLPIQKRLGVVKPGLDGVADKNQPFNATDVVDSSLPWRRFLAAGRENDVWLVALEHGGRGYNVQAYLLSSAGKLRRHWVLPGSTTTFQDVVDEVSKVQPPAFYGETRPRPPCTGNSLERCVDTTERVP